MSALFTSLQASQWIEGARLVGAGDAPILRVHTDTRTIEPGDLFVALKGDRFDANAFLHEAQSKGAVAVVCHTGLDVRRQPQGMDRIEVANTKHALAELASRWRSQFSLPVIAVAGSNGKTTVTQMIAAILHAAHPDGGALATAGNLNNDIGVPLSVLRLRTEHACAVFELGMNHPGEIAELSAIAKPTVALVNNAQREHLEFMLTVDAVARENGAVITALGPQGVTVFPVDDPYAPLWKAMAGQRRSVGFTLAGPGSHDVLACRQAQWSDGAWSVQAGGLGVELQYRLGIAGRHNVQNSLAAAACALAAGVSVQAVEQGLTAFTPVHGRSRALQLQVLGHDVTLIDDTYNANPDSVRAAIDVLAELPGPRLLVLGDMGEVGHQGAMFHAEAGRYALAKGIDRLMATGPLSRATADVFAGSRYCETVDELSDAVLADLHQVRSVLVKGSRFMRMERVVNAAVHNNPIHKEASDVV